MDSQLVRQWEKDGVRFEIREVQAVYSDHYCGYCKFDQRPVREPGYNGLLTYVPVHGGITYAEQDSDGWMCYGFDCAHCDDEHDPKVRDLGWLIGECERMAEAIKAAVPFEPAYLLAADGEARAKIIDAYHAQLSSAGIEFVVTDNLGAMLKLMAGML